MCETPRAAKEVPLLVPRRLTFVGSAALSIGAEREAADPRPDEAPEAQDEARVTRTRSLVWLPVATLMAFTDGLVERRGEKLDRDIAIVGLRWTS
jgi:hypothetical protein